MISRRGLFRSAALIGAAAGIGVRMPDTELKLGKAAATPQKVLLRLCDYITNVPQPPASFGHQSLVPSWGMMMNDRIGCCVFSGAGHEHKLWTTEGGTPADFTDRNIISAYSAVTGYDPAKDSPHGNPTDHGTNVSAALKWRRTVGMTDSAGDIHRLDAYAQIEPQPDTIAQAAWLFSAVGVGIQFPAYAMSQFKAGIPWDVASTNTAILGGHYVPIVGVSAGMFICVTWGRLQLITPAFLMKYCDEAYAVFDSEFFVNNRSPEEFDAATLQCDLAALTAA